MRLAHSPKRFLPGLAALALAAAIAAPAVADTTIFSTLGPDGTDFNDNLGYTETGSGSFLGAFSAGAKFILPASGVLSSITVAAANDAGTNIAHFYLTDNIADLGNPSAALAGFTLTNLPSFGTSFTPEVGTPAQHPLLAAGTTYYLYELETGNTIDGFDDSSFPTGGVMGTVERSSNGSPYSSGNNISVLPAFSIQVADASAVPEPSPLALLVMGLLPAGLLVRRRRAARH